MNIELKTFSPQMNHGAANSCNQQVTAAGNGDSVANRHDGAAECEELLSVRVSCNNGEAAQCQRNGGNVHAAQESSAVRRIKKELSDPVFWKVPLWALIILIFILIIAVILISLAVCSVIHEDEDDQFDPSSFTVPRFFNGSFQIPSLVFTEELSTFSSNQSQALAADLQNKLDDLYRSSPALGRYFSRAEIFAFRNGSVVADYELKFLLPEEQQEPLRRFTVSREMVFNVFRQFLYDQEPDESGNIYIDPVSLTMFSSP